MIPPSLLNITYYFSLLPVWEQEPVPTEPCPTPAASDGSQPDGESATPPANAQPAGDADGINDQVALRLVFKGYKLTAVEDWNCLSNTGYERWVENRADDDAERQRQDQRARSATRPNPHAPTGPEQPGTTPSASSHCDE